MASSIVIDGLGLDSCESIDDGDTDGFPPHKPNATGRQSQRGTGDRYTVHYSKREQTRRPARLLRLLTWSTRVGLTSATDVMRKVGYYRCFSSNHQWASHHGTIVACFQPDRQLRRLLQHSSEGSSVLPGWLAAKHTPEGRIKRQSALHVSSLPHRHVGLLGLFRAPTRWPALKSRKISAGWLRRSSACLGQRGAEKNQNGPVDVSLRFSSAAASDASVAHGRAGCCCCRAGRHPLWEVWSTEQQQRTFLRSWMRGIVDDWLTGKVDKSTNQQHIYSMLCLVRILESTVAFCQAAAGRDMCHISKLLPASSGDGGRDSLLLWTLSILPDSVLRGCPA